MIIFCKKLMVLGMKVDLTEQRIYTPREALDAILERGIPATRAALKSFIGSIAWHGSHLVGHAEATAVLQRMCRKDNEFNWEERSLKAYELLMSLFSRPACFNSLQADDLPFHIVVDASDHCAGMVLLQITPNDEIKIIQYHSQLFDDRVSRLSSFERESHGALYALHSFMDMVQGRQTTLHTDSRSSV